MPETDLSLLRKVAEKAGEIALKHFQSDPQVWEKDDNAGPVTEADLEVNAYLQDSLREARPDYGWLSEESEDTADRLSTRRQFVVDPIDGTRAFIDGSLDWGHSIAVVEDGVPVAGVVALPARKLMFAAAKGQGASCNNEPLAVRDPRPVDRTVVLTARPNLKRHWWSDGERPPFEQAFRSSLAYRMALVAKGQFDAMLTLRPAWEWDIAAGTLLIAEAGGRVINRHGNHLRFNNSDPLLDGVLAGEAALVGTLESALA